MSMDDLYNCCGCMWGAISAIMVVGSIIYAFTNNSSDSSYENTEIVPEYTAPTNVEQHSVSTPVQNSVETCSSSHSVSTPIQNSVETRSSSHSVSPDDAYNEGYDEGYEQGLYDGHHGYSHGHGYDDSNDYHNHYKTRYCEGYEEGYDDGYPTGYSEYEDNEDTEYED